MGYLKALVDTLVNVANGLEETLADDANVLEGFERSVQLDGYSCGAQSAFMILSYYGKARSIDAVERALGTDEDGTSTGQILTLLRQRKLRPRVVAQAGMKHLTAAIRGGSPVLVSLDDEGHWGVVYGFARSHVYLADPSLGGSLTCRVPRADFHERWDRWAMIVGR